MGSYDKLSEASLEQLTRILFGSEPIDLDDGAFDKIYSKKSGELNAIGTSRTKAEKEMLKIYLDV
jgi:hypothetical protein